MRTPSGILHVVDFKTSQIVSTIQPKDYWDDKRHWEIKNNIDTLEFKVFDNTEHAATLMQQNLVLKEVRDGRIVPYVITEAEKDSDDRSVIAYASGEWIQLAKAGIIPPQELEVKTVNELVDMALVGTNWKRGQTEYSGFHSMTIDEFIDPLSFLKKIASLFELEIQYRAEVVGSQIVGRYVDMVKKRGRETGKEVTLGKDLMGIKRIENSQNICTALIGFVKKEGKEVLTIADINNGVPYIVDVDAFQRWNERGQHKFGFYSPETEEAITPQRLLTLMKTEIKKRVNTSVSYEVNAQSIGRVFGLAHELINEGDTIRIKDTGFTPKLYLEARAIAADESFTDPTQDKYVFGDYREIVNVNEELQKWYSKILSILGSKANKELLDKLEELVQENDKKTNTAQKESEAAKQLAEQVVENLKNYQTTIYEGVNPPTKGLEPGKSLWLDISQGKPGILKKWNGTEWEVLVKDYGKDVKTLDERTAEVQKSVKGLTSTVDQLTITTTDQGKQILEANTKIEQTSQKIEAKVDIKQVEDYIGGIGPTNEIRNTRFTQGTKYWGLGSKFPAVVDKDTTFLGDSSIKLTVTGETAPAYNSFTSNRIPVTPGENVVVSAYFMTKNIDEHYNKKIRMVAVFWKSDGTQFSAGTYDFTIKNDTWTRQEFTKVTPPEAALVGLRAYVLQNGTFWMAHPMLQKGTKASSFIENPNDMVDKDKIIDDLADKVATADYNQKVTDIERRISATEKGVEISAKKEETYTRKEVDGTFATGAYVKAMEGRIEVTENGIKNTVQKGTVISSINQSAEAVDIDAKRIGLKGFVTAEHIKGQVLEGVTLKTTGSRFVEMNNQDFKICDTIKPRAYMGFAETTDGSINPTFVLGSDNTKFNGAGSFYIYQTTPRINGFEQPSKAWATIGISKGNNAEGNNRWSTFIQMQNDGGHLYTYADGRLYFDCLNDIVFNSVGWAPGYGKFSVTTTEPHYFTNNYGEFNFQRKGSGNKIYFSNGANDHDLVMGRVMIRSSLASGYDTGLQIKDTFGNAWRDMELRTLKANGNITATGGVWGREFIPNSSRKIKTNIEDLEFSALQKLNSVRIKKYNMISDVEKYNAGEIDVLPIYYGMIAEDSDDVFTTPEKNAVTLYSSVSITMQSVQELDWKADNMQFDIGILKQKFEAEKREKVSVQDQLDELKDLVVRQEDRIAKLEELLLKQLINEKPEQP
ncbi:phage tail spike protein [Bacillus cereus group sp. BfR-BA-01310]|uniref:phage tail spike protein n=1 Tax=Bacillus cereus group sp. BfR-BA-01310 TaxID=2920287 RepID=UPI001F596992|nr:phage tail spike protein [Bacillus cereus group sp. BfR-BA-01310]